MTARQATILLQHRLRDRGINASFEQANILRRAERTLRRWYELECGNSDNYKSWAIEREEKSERPYMIYHPHSGLPALRLAIHDREAGAKRRVEVVAKELGLYVHYQTDPRGASLYVHTEPFPEFDHNRGVCCAVY